MLELRKVLWNKKAQELKDGRQTRAETKLEEAQKVHNTVEQAEGLLSAKTQDATKYLDEVVNELPTIKAEVLPEFDPEWFPTVRRAYMAYGPSLENPHVHRGFLSPHNGACMTN